MTDEPYDTSEHPIRSDASDALWHPTYGSSWPDDDRGARDSAGPDVTDDSTTYWRAATHDPEAMFSEPYPPPDSASTDQSAAAAENALSQTLSVTDPLGQTLAASDPLGETMPAGFDSSFVSDRFATRPGGFEGSGFDGPGFGGAGFERSGFDGGEFDGPVPAGGAGWLSEAPLEQPRDSFREQPSGRAAFWPDPAPVEPTESAEPSGAATGSDRPRIVAPEQATARLHIRMPERPPVPASTLRPRATWDEAAESAVSVAAVPFTNVSSLASPTALPGDIAALTTATMLVPVTGTRRPRAAMLTTALPPDHGARGNAAAIEDAFTDTIEQIFGIDFDAPYVPVRADQRDAAYQRDAIGASESPWSAEPEFPAAPDEVRTAGRGGSVAADPADHADVTDWSDGAPAWRSRSRSGRSAASLWYAAPYGVPTQPAPYDGLGEDPASSFLSARRRDGALPGAVFHDSTGETAYVDPSRTGQLPAIRLDDPWSAPSQPPTWPRVPAARSAGAAFDPLAQTYRALPAAGDAAMADGIAAGSGDAAVPPWPHAPRGEQRRARQGTARDTPPDRSDASSRRGGALVTLLGLLACFGLVYAIAVLVAGSATGDDVPAGTRVLGVDLGGLSSAAASERLAGGLAAATGQPIRIVTGHTSLEFSPAASGLSVDTAATVRAARSGGLNPLTVIPALFGAHREVAPRISVNRTMLGAALHRAAALYDVPMTPGSIVFQGTTPAVVAPRAGQTLDVASAAQVITSGWLRGGDEFAIASITRDPPVTQEQLTAAVDTIALPALARPVTVVTGSVSTTLTPDQLATLLTIQPDAAGQLEPVVDGTALRAELDPRVAALETPATDASFSIVAGVPVLVPARTGRGFSPAALATAVEAALRTPATSGSANSARVATVPIGPLPPRLTTAQASALGVTDVLASQTSTVGTGTPESHNLATAIGAVTGSVVAPGQTFDFDALAGPYTAAHGYVEGQQPNGSGDEVPALGAGASGLATPLYQVSLRAGMREIERHGYAVYQSLYPAGMDAEVGQYGGDLRFANDAAHPLYVSAVLRGGTLSVALLGEHQDDVAVQTSAHTDVVAPSDTTEHGPGCVADPGQSGFTVTVTQVLSQGGNQVASRSYQSTYQPRAGVSCAGDADRAANGAGSSGDGTASPDDGGRSAPDQHGSSTPSGSSSHAPTTTPSAPGVLGL